MFLSTAGLCHSVNVRSLESILGLQGIAGAAFSARGKGMFADDCAFDAESLEVLRQSFVELKILPTAPDMSKLYTTKRVPTSWTTEGGHLD